MMQPAKEQFYTAESVAKECVNTIVSTLHDSHNCLWVEPSAGNGAFLNNVPSTFDTVGVDIEPLSNNIVRHDFLTWKLKNPADKSIIIFGNPPFGKRSKLAKAFIKKSCKIREVIAIAFILPKSFVKPSMNNAFDLKFNCVYSKELPKNAFFFNGTHYDVPCVFQIWKRDLQDRAVAVAESPRGFSYVKADAAHDIIFIRIGRNAGKCQVKSETKYNQQSHHFIKLNDEHVGRVGDVVKKINMYVFPSNTLGPRSLSKGEINAVINVILV
jgi:hypothetical protein